MAIEDTQKQIEQAKSQAQLAEQQITAYQKTIPSITQRLLRAVGYSSPQQAQLQRQKISQARETSSQALQGVKEYQEQVSQYEQEFQNYLKSDTGKLEYAKQSGAVPVSYETVSIGYGESVQVPVYSTPYGNVRDNVMLQKEAGQKFKELGAISAYGQATGTGGFDVATQKFVNIPKQLQTIPDFKPDTSGGVTSMADFKINYAPANQAKQIMTSPITGFSIGGDMFPLASAQEREVGIGAYGGISIQEAPKTFIQKAEEFVKGFGRVEPPKQVDIFGKTFVQVKAQEYGTKMDVPRTEFIEMKPSEPSFVSKLFSETQYQPKIEPIYLGGKETTFFNQPRLTPSPTGIQGTAYMQFSETKDITPDYSTGLIRGVEQRILPTGAGVPITLLNEQVYLPDKQARDTFKEYINKKSTTEIQRLIREQQAEYKRDVGALNMLKLKYGDNPTDAQIQEINNIVERINEGQKGTFEDIVFKATRGTTGQKVLYGGLQVGRFGYEAGKIALAFEAGVGALGSLGVGGSSLFTGTVGQLKTLKLAGLGSEIALGGSFVGLAGAQEYSKRGDVLSAVGAGLGTGIGLFGGRAIKSGTDFFTSYKFDRFARPAPSIQKVSQAENIMSPDYLLKKTPQADILTIPFTGKAVSVEATAGSDILVMQNKIRKILGLGPKFISEPQAILTIGGKVFKQTREQYLAGYQKALKVLKKDYGLSLNQAKQFIRNIRPEVSVRSSEYAGVVISDFKDPLQIKYTGKTAEVSPGFTITTDKVSYPLKSKALKIKGIGSEFEETFLKIPKGKEAGSIGELTGYKGGTQEVDVLAKLGRQTRQFKEASVVKKVPGTPVTEAISEKFGLDISKYKADSGAVEVTYRIPKKLSVSKSDITVITPRQRTQVTEDYLRGEKVTDIFFRDKTLSVTEPLGIKIAKPKPKVDKVLSSSELDKIITGKQELIIKDLKSIYGEPTKQQVAELSASILTPKPSKVIKTTQLAKQSEMFPLVSGKIEQPKLSIKVTTGEQTPISITSQSLYYGTGEYERTDVVSPINVSKADTSLTLKLKETNINRLGLATFQLGRMDDRLAPRLRDLSKVDFKDALTFKTKQETGQRTAQVTTPISRITPTTRTTTRLTPRPPRIKIGALTIPLSKEGIKPVKVKRIIPGEKFIAITKRRRKEVVLGIFATPQIAERIAKRSALQTLGATAKVRTTKGRQVQVSPDIIFRVSKTDPLAVVQRQRGMGGRLASKSERLEILSSRRGSKFKI